MPGPVPLDKIQIKVSDSEKTQPALHPSRKEQMMFVRFTPPVQDMENRADHDAWMERVAYLCDDLHWLLQQPHDKFWCQVVFDDTLHKALDSFLHHSPRSAEALLHLPEAGKQRHLELSRLVFMVYLRMSTHKESKDHFITPSVFGEILYNNFLLDIPKMLDLAAIYGKTNSAILNKMLNNVFTQQPNYREDLSQTLPTILQVFSNIASRCGIHLDAPGLTPQKLDGDASKGLVAMATEDLEDIVLYLYDTVDSLFRFLEVYPPACAVFNQFNFCPILANFYECMHFELTTVVKQHNFESPRLRKQLIAKLAHIKKTVVSLFHHIVNTTCLQPILEHTNDEEKVSSCVEEFLHIMTSVLGERRFLAAHEELFNFQDNVELLTQASSTIDSSQFSYIQSAINSAFASFGRRKSPRGNTNTGGRTSPDGAPDASGSLAAAAAPSQPAASPQSHDTGDGRDSPSLGLPGTGAVSNPRPGEVEVVSLISVVKDLFPEMGDGFIEMCLEELNWNSDSVVSAILEDRLPSSLQGVERDKPRVTRQPDQGDGQVDGENILDSRRNVFDNDEFDVFRNQVDMSRMHKGKKDVQVDLEDKTLVQALKATYDAYGSMDKESMYDNFAMYDDEYDDTYDTTNVGADDADSADELTKETPRVLQQIAYKKAKDEGRLQKWADSGDSDDNDSGDWRAGVARGDFVSDPAKLREAAEQRRQSQAARRGKGGGGGGGQPHRTRDVVGGPKGQGQSKDVQQNRKSKEKHKGARHRNAADKKMSKGMF